MENSACLTESQGQDRIEHDTTDQQYSAPQNMTVQPSTSQDEVNQRGGYEMQDMCADGCYCLGFILTLGLIACCCSPEDMH